MRYLMPVVVMTRGESGKAQSQFSDITQPALRNILALLQPAVEGCPAGGLRTWCSIIDGQPQMVPTHQLAVAYLVSELLRLTVENDLDRSAQTVRVIRRTFDVLLWDHVLLMGTTIRNSQTERWSVSPAVSRMRQQIKNFETNPLESNPIQFQVDGWLIAIAANLMAIEKSADAELKLSLAVRERGALTELVDTGVKLLEQRLEKTRIHDFTGGEAEGGVFDRLLWDGHEYRRFSAITALERPMSVKYDEQTNTYEPVFLVGREARFEGSGHDSGHYRRLVWLYYTLMQASHTLGRDWAKADQMRSLANQFAYSVFKHPCREGECVSGGELAPVPVFANYATGHDGWYRVTPYEPCEPGVPPSGFSTLMLLSENLWWASHNRDVLKIWNQLDAALNDDKLAPPSHGVEVPCQAAGERMWHETYREKAMQPDATLSHYGVAFFAMRHWASTALGN